MLVYGRLWPPCIVTGQVLFHYLSKRNVFHGPVQKGPVGQDLHDCLVHRLDLESQYR